MAKMMTSIVGGSFHTGAVLATAKLNKGEELWLIRETQNSFDKNAVAVHTVDGQKLGYVPRQDAPAIAKVLDLGVPCRVETRGAGSTSISISWEA